MLKGLLLILLILPAVVLSGAVVNLNVAPEKIKNGSNWAFKTGAYYTTLDDFNMGAGLAWDAYTNQVSELELRGMTVTNPMDYKTFRMAYLGNAVYQASVLARALDDPMLQNPTNQYLLRALFRQSLTEFYIREMLGHDRASLEPSRQEIDQYYQENRERIEASGLPITEVIRLIQNELASRRFQAAQSNFIEETVRKTPIETNSAYFR